MKEEMKQAGSNGMIGRANQQLRMWSVVESHKSQFTTDSVLLSPTRATRDERALLEDAQRLHSFMQSNESLNNVRRRSNGVYLTLVPKLIPFL